MSTLAIRKALPANQVNANVATAQIFSLQQNSLLACTIAIPGKLVLEQKKFRVRASGNLFTGASLTALPTIYYAASLPSSPLVAANWTNPLCTGTAQTVANTWSPWQIEADNLIYESGGGTMQGTFSQLLNNIWTAPAALTNRPTGINGTNAVVGSTAIQDPVLYLAVAMTFGTANAANLANLNEFVLEF